MISLGLSVEEQRDFEQVLRTPHCLRVRVGLLDLEHRHLADLSPFFQDGQVDLDGGEGVEADRAVQIRFQDREYKLGLDTRDPASLQTGPNHMLSIEYCVRRPGVNQRWFEVPVFTGPLTKVERKGADVVVEGLGKEYLCRHAMHGTRTWSKGTAKATVIRQILLSVCGEYADRVDVASNASARIAEPVTLLSEDDPWALASSLAQQLGWCLQYNGRGDVYCGPKVNRTVFAWRTGPGGTVLDLPTTGTDYFALVNRWRVVGRAKSAKKQDPVGVALAPATSQTNPYRLGRNGVGLAWTREETDNTATTTAAAQAKANQLRDRDSGVTVTASGFTVLVTPHVELGDIVELQTDTFGRQFKLDKSSIPLSSDARQSVGVVARVSRR